MTLKITYKSGRTRTIPNCCSADIEPNDTLYYGRYKSGLLIGRTLNENTEYERDILYSDDVDLRKVAKMEIIFDENT